jgi:hypothetical protein
VLILHFRTSTPAKSTGKGRGSGRGAKKNKTEIECERDECLTRLSHCNFLNEFAVLYSDQTKLMAAP